MLISRIPASPRATAWWASIAFLIALVTLVPALTQRLHPAQAAPAPASVPLQIVALPSPHYTKTSGRKIDTVIIHYTSGINVDPQRWDDPVLNRDIFKRYHVSAHYMLGRDGTAYRLVDEKNIAWHAGGSIMPAPDNRKGANRFSIGIEMIATAKSGFTDAQYQSLAQLIGQIKSRHPIKHLLGHDDIAGTRAVKMGLRKDCKPDPGPQFEWARLRTMLKY